MASVTELIRNQDDWAATVVGYTREKTSLGEISSNFPHVEGRSFHQWLEDVDSQDVHVLEFGGGTDQIAAQQILTLYPNIERYTAYEIRQLSQEGEQVSRDHPQFLYIKSGLSDFDPSELQNRNVHVAFAHNVAEHLSHPFELVRKLHEALVPGGVLFVNGIPIHREVAHDVIQEWEDEGADVYYRFPSTESVLFKSGIAKLDIGIRKTGGTIFVPPVTDTPLQDFSGRKLRTLAYRRIRR